MIKVIRGGNFFSSTNCRLEDIIEYFNKNQKLPETIDSSAIWTPYKTSVTDDVYNRYFVQRPEIDIKYTHEIKWSSSDWEPQFSDYRKLNFTDLKPFIDKYFAFCDRVNFCEKYLKEKYKIDVSNLCCVMLRGNDKWKETNIPSYDEMINKAKFVQSRNPDIKFLIQTDEREFLEAFLKVFPDSIYIEEIPVRNRCRDNSHSCLPFVLPQRTLLETTFYYIAVVKIFSQAKFVITTSGNGEMWFALLRGNADNMYQYLNPKEIMYGVYNKTFDKNKSYFWFDV